MPLVAEDGTGYANADSLASVEFADTYHADRGNTAWAGFDLARKEQLLRRATDYIRYTFGAAFVGSKASTSQSMPFPRIIDYVNVGNPVEVQEATAELALVANDTDLLAKTTSVAKKSVKVGSISVEYDNANFTGPRFVAATTRLAAYVGRGFSQVTARLVRT
jgi:hypothetical protein